MKYLYTLLLIFICGSAVSQNISGVVNIYRKVLHADSATGRLKLSDVTGLSGNIGYKAMIIQMKGATIDETNTANFGNINAINEAGYYEVGTICGFLSDTVVMERKLNNFYNVNGLVQFVIIPKYTNATVTDTLKALNWEGNVGGVVAIEVTGTLTLNKPISANGSGFRGGSWVQFGATCNVFGGTSAQYFAFTANSNNNGGKKGEGIAEYITNKEYGRGKLANGGGGGNNHNAGGAGGSNYNTGGLGGNRTGSAGSCTNTSPAAGGILLNNLGYSLATSAQNRLFLGGGGGAGHDNDGYGMPGANGGGIVLIIANTVTGNSALSSDNKIMANGDSTGRYNPLLGAWQTGSYSDGSGGGGGGGVVVLNVNTFSGNSITAEAKGGRGGNSELAGNPQCSGPGGGGGGGVVWLKSPSIPGLVTSNVSGGSNGIIFFSASACNGSANGAGAGSNGATLFNFAFAAPKDTSTVCKQILPIKINVNLSGYRDNSHINHIRFSVINLDLMHTATLQASGNGIDFYDVKTWNSKLPLYTFTETNAPAKTYYRVKLHSISGSVNYSAILFLSNNYTESLKLVIQPNPVINNLSAQITTPESSPAQIIVTDMMGNKIMQQRLNLATGTNIFSAGTEHMPSGMYYLQVITGKGRLVQSFVKLP